jgi:hypothetical protein
MNTNRGRIVAALALALAVTAGCGHGGSHHATTKTSARDRARPVWTEYTRCARMHGMPTMPDPVVDSQGRADFPGVEKQQMEEVQDACGGILHRLPASAQGNSGRPVTAANLAKLRSFAQCVRTHGVPAFPDPKPNGSFPADQAPVPKPVDAIKACEHLLPAGDSGVSFR